MKYACRQKYFSSGLVEASVFPVDDTAEPYQKIKPGFDEYLDIFDTKAEAEKYKRDALNA